MSKEGFRGDVHSWFDDSKFMNIIKKLAADFVIWFTPYKALERDGLDFPHVVVINPRLIDNSIFVDYDPKLMIDATRVQRKQ